MRTTQAKATLSEEALGQLQGLMLQAILAGSPLPGRDAALDLPDLPALLAQPAVILSSENLGGPLDVPDVSRPIYILPEDAIQERAHSEGDFLYLQFQPPMGTDGGILLTLSIQIAQGQQGVPRLGMSGVQVIFRRNTKGWQADEESAAFAA